MSLTDRKKTELLTKLGFLYLEKMGCFEISTEIAVSSWAMRDFKIETDRHYHVDVLGIEWEYLPPSKQYVDDESNEKIIKKPIVRGIEIKVSRGDFKNGFVHCGCHYNYLMIPRGLVEHTEVHSDIGVIEVEFDKVAVKIGKAPWYGYDLSGVTMTRKPKRKEVREIFIKNIWGQMSPNLTNQVKRWLRDELSKPLLVFNEGREEAVK